MSVSSSLQHSHDVQIIWWCWPFINIIPAVVRELVGGYGINPIFTWMADIAWWPIFIWDMFWWVWGWPLNVIIDIVMFIPNAAYYTFGGSLFLVYQQFMFLGRRLTGWLQIETLAVAGGLGYLVYWVVTDPEASTEIGKFLSDLASDLSEATSTDSD